MYGYFCIGFIDFMLKGIHLLEYTNLFRSKEYEKNDKIVFYCILCSKYRKFKTPKYHIFLKSISSFYCLREVWQ